MDRGTVLKQVLQTLNLSPKRFAELIKGNELTVRSWARGRSHLPADIEQWVQKMAHFLQENPPPVRNREEDR